MLSFPFFHLSIFHKPSLENNWGVLLWLTSWREKPSFQCSILYCNTCEYYSGALSVTSNIKQIDFYLSEIQNYRTLQEEVNNVSMWCICEQNLEVVNDWSNLVISLMTWGEEEMKNETGSTYFFNYFITSLDLKNKGTCKSNFNSKKLLGT